MVVALAACDAVLPIHEGRPQDDTSVFCGPVLACGRNDPAVACCVTVGDSGVAPESFVYSCTTKDGCVAAGGPSTLISCDEPSDCANDGSKVCCWPSTTMPRVSYCFPSEATNCATELCNPNDAVPCVNHAGYTCEPTTVGWPDTASPLGYFACKKTP
jgi:hypothetical protein